jgi:hypothetical protein
MKCVFLVLIEYDEENAPAIEAAFNSVLDANEFLIQKEKEFPTCRIFVKEIEVK